MIPDSRTRCVYRLMYCKYDDYGTSSLHVLLFGIHDQLLCFLSKLKYITNYRYVDMIGHSARVDFTHCMPHKYFPFSTQFSPASVFRFINLHDLNSRTASDGRDRTEETPRKSF
jgi:hypothetical protein